MSRDLARQIAVMRRLAQRCGNVFRVDFRRRPFTWAGSRFPFAICDGRTGGVVDVAGEEDLADLIARSRTACA